MNEERITYFAQTDSRSKKINFGIKAKDRTRHVYVIGKTGMGKSTLLENMAVQDIKNGEGMAFIDPHGKTADLLLEYVPPERVKDVVYFAPFDTNFPISFNVLESVDPDKRHLVVSGLMSTFKKIWQDAWSARMEYILTNTLLALLEYPGATLLGVNRMLAEKDFRKDVIDHVTDISVKNFWVKEFANYTERMAAEAVPSIQNKIGQFTANALIRNMIGQPKSSFDIRAIMDSKKILIINLSKGRIGESNANLLGGMLITKIYLAALSRADVPERVLRTMPNFYLFVDEFQSFANESFADILSEARKYKLNLTIAHQYIEQMEEEVRAAVFGNVGTMIIFRVGAYDAEVLEKEFAPVFTAEDIVNLGAYQIYLKLMIDGISSAPFSATSLPPIPLPEVSSAEKVIETSRAQFAMNRTDVENTIEKWHEPLRKGSATPAGASVGATGGSSNSSSSILPPVASATIPNTSSVSQSASVISSVIKAVARSAIIPPQAPVKSAAPVIQTTPTAPVVSRPTTYPPRFVPPSIHPSVPPRQREAQPFKQAFEKPLERESNQERNKPAIAASGAQSDPISLASLSKRSPENFLNNKGDSKIPTPRNINDLKNALASIIHKDVPPVAVAAIFTDTTKPKSQTEHNTSQPKEVNTSKSTQEVPKDVLEKLLKVG